MGRADIERGEPARRYLAEAYQMVMQANLPSTLSEQQTQLLDQAAMELQKAYAVLMTGTGDFKAAYSAFELAWYRAVCLSDAFDAGRVNRIRQTLGQIVQAIPDSSDIIGIRTHIQNFVIRLEMRITDERMSIERYNGPGTYSHLDGRFYHGDIRNGQPTGSGKIVFPAFPKLLQGGPMEYVGEVDGGLPNGQGRMTYPNGMIYEGSFVMGKREGQARFTWPDGWVYEGEFQADKMTGRGTKTTNTGMSFTTTFIDGKANGPGTVITPDGRVQHGVFKDDKFIPGS